MKKVYCSHAVAVIVAIVLATGFSSCVNEEYDPENLNTEITIAGEGLTLPLGTTKQLTLKSLLSSMDDDMLQVLDGGAYALRINDTLSLGEQLPDLKGMLDIPDISFATEASVDLSSVNLESVKIEEQTFAYDLDLIDESILVDVSLPTVEENHNSATGLWEYGKSAHDMVLEVNDVHLSTKPLFRIPAGLNPGPSETVKIGDIPDAVVDAQTVNVIIKSECSGGISGISDVLMSETSLINVKLSVENSFLAKGSVIPDLTLDLGGLLLLEGDKGNILMDKEFTLNESNGYVASKSFRIKEVNVEKDDWDAEGKLELVKTLAVSGKSSLKDAYADASKIDGSADGLGLRIDVEFMDLTIESVTMDVEEVAVSEDIVIPMSMPETTLPDGISGIDHVTFTENSAVDLSIDLENLSDIEGLETTLEKLVMTFPEEITVKDAVDGKVVFENVDLSGGFKEKIYIERIDFDDAVDGRFSYEAEIHIVADMTAGGRICSAHLPYEEENDGVFVVHATSDFELEDYFADIECFEYEISEVQNELKYDLPESLADVGTFTIIPEGNPVITVTIDVPDESLDLSASENGLVLAFPDFLCFGEVSGEYDLDRTLNHLTIKGDIPEIIELPLEKLVVSPAKDSETGTYCIKGEVLLSGSVAMAEGEVSGGELKEVVNHPSGIELVVPEFIPDIINVDTFEIKVSDAYDFTLLAAGDLPKEIKEVSDVVLNDVEAVIDLAIDNLPDFGEGKEFVADFSVTMPEALVLDQDDARVDGATIRITGPIGADGLAVEPFKVASIDLSGFDMSAGEDLSGSIAVDGRIYVDDPDVDLSELENEINISLSASIRDIEIEKVVAKVDYHTEGMNESFELTGLPDFMKGDDFVLDLVDPHLVIKVKTNIGIPVVGNLSVIPIVNGSEVTENAIVSTIELPYTETAEKVESVVLWFGSSADRCPSGYTFVEAAINDLIRNIPDELRISLDAGASSDKDCIVEPSADYVLDMEYDFVIPLEFGEDLSIAISDTLGGLPDIMSELLAKNVLQLGGSVTSSLPLCLELEVKMLDRNDEEILMDKPAVQSISSCNPDGSAVVSPLEFTLDAQDGALAGGLGSLVLSFKVTSPNFTGIPVGEDDFVQADLKVVLPDGITLDLANLDSDEN